MNFVRKHYDYRIHYMILFILGYGLGFITNYFMNGIPFLNALMSAIWYAITLVTISFVAFESGRRIKKR